MKRALSRLLLGVFLGTFNSSYALANQADFSLPHKPSQLIVKFKKNSFFDEETHLGPDTKILHRYANGAVLVELPPHMVGEEKNFAQELLREDDVEYVEPNYEIHVDAVPNDPSFKNLYGMNKISAPSAWDITKGSKKVIVGVIDTGIDCTHPDLTPNCATNKGETGFDLRLRDKRFNGVDDDKNGFVDDFRGWDFANNDNLPFDDHGHGTHVAGTIGAVGNNGVGVAGVAWEVSFFGLKFLDASGSGTLDAAVRAIDYANMMNIPITNNSWGGGGFSQTLEDAIKRGQAKGLLFVAAAGNEAENNDQVPAYPASYKLDNIISVAATDSKDVLAGFSNVGKTSVHLSAPGVQIFSSMPGNRYGAMSGTSMATPHVVGVAALLKARYPMAMYPELKRRLLGGVDPVAGLKDKTITGGRLNALNSLKMP